MKCNNLKCRESIHNRAIITICCHIFCPKCGPKIKKSSMCSACQNFLKEEDILLKEIDVLPCLLGYNPEEIFEAARRGLSFWINQNEIENSIQNLKSDSLESQCMKYKKDLKSLESATKIEMDSLQAKINKLERNIEKERQNSYDLSVMLSEKTKQYQRLVTENEKVKFKRNLNNSITYDLLNSKIEDIND
ncbi:hypothetical protein CWI37_0175p0020 [Hamiltosporidium tvaerminnensis]|uniref:RING-type domain-containing protein n=2 Tax=Hamiltosporidium TaxID=1176354 RepID=A0A4Q9L3H3_9MICR|nr:cyclin B1 interacting protein 1, E3 ubiquitin protein ligase [Hamiltosporidium tvaerminnensis]TBU02049.1 hypothetical protein CWI36_1201p0010 [Hamiltosporidium magnivora]TBU04163.1 hypothetical protein CWI37_0175p0020 [Hamiltosporidium tvaerminnensis]TBU09408.1 hypothetical protein CWI39_0075p0040 [Hamiltosporidium magnivora]